MPRRKIRRRRSRPKRMSRCAATRRTRVIPSLLPPESHHRVVCTIGSGVRGLIVSVGAHATSDAQEEEGSKSLIILYSTLTTASRMRLRFRSAPPAALLPKPYLALPSLSLLQHSLLHRRSQLQPNQRLRELGQPAHHPPSRVRAVPHLRRLHPLLQHPLLRPKRSIRHCTTLQGKKGRCSWSRGSMWR